MAKHPLALSLLAGDFCHLMITFISSLDPDQDPQNVSISVRPDLNPNYFDTLIVFLKEVMEKKKVFEKVSKHEKLPNMQRLIKVLI